MEIRCKKGNCKHNTGCSCSAKEVEIDRNVTCTSYVNDEIKQDLIIENGNIFDIAESMVTKNLKSVPLACRARDCLYNHDLKCRANGITVIDSDGETDTDNIDCADCATFVKR